VRQRFVDTAFWNANVLTGPDGAARITFEVPGNLTTWRATARAITSDTRVGAGTSSIQASRPVMLRLATPRQLVKGDRLELIGTVNNRTGQPHEFETAISAQGLSIVGDTTKKVHVPANGEGTVRWTIVADTIPDDGQAFITGRTIASDAAVNAGPELSDALKVGVKVVPDGISECIETTGVLNQQKTVTLDLPADRIEPATTLDVSIHAGLGGVSAAYARQALSSFIIIRISARIPRTTVFRRNHESPSDDSVPKESRESLGRQCSEGITRVPRTTAAPGYCCPGDTATTVCVNMIERKAYSVLSGISMVPVPA